MRLLALLFVVASGALAQAPVFTNMGPLSCGIRLYLPGQVQEYCYYNSPPAPLAIICNALHSGTSLPLAVSHSCYATDAAQGNVYGVTWAVWPAGGAISFRISSTQQPCQVNGQGACVSYAGSTATTTTQSGTFTGPLASVETVTVEGEVAANNEFTPDLFPYWFWK